MKKNVLNLTNLDEIYVVEPENNFVFPHRFLSSGVDFDMRIMHRFNGAGIEQNAITTKYIDESSAN